MQIPIVDRYDQLIGFKERAKVDLKQDIFRTASLWITNSRGDILLAQRKFDKKTDPGKWAEAVGGTVEGHDTYEETVIREAQEELGLQRLKLVPGPKQFITTPCNYFVQWFITSVDKPADEFVIQPEEVEQIAWIEYAQLQKELTESPKKYIDAMPAIVRLLS